MQLENGPFIGRYLYWKLQIVTEKGTFTKLYIAL